MLRCGLALVLALGAVGWAAADDKEPTGPHDPALRAVCLEFVAAVLVTPDPERLAPLIDKQAASKKRGPGSALQIVEDLKKPGKKEFFLQNFRLQGVQLFTAETLPDIQKQHPQVRYLTGDRVPAHLEGGLGCLFQFRHVGQNRLYTNALVAKKVGDKAVIVYMDDEP